jgi:hypothetical protein
MLASNFDIFASNAETFASNFDIFASNPRDAREQL